MNDKTLVEEARAWPAVEWDALSAGKVGELLNKLADTIEAQATRIEALEAALADARSFIDEDSPDWRHAKQAQLAAIDAALEGSGND